MGKITILNKEPNFRTDTCQRVTSDSGICEINKDTITVISMPFAILRESGNSISNVESLTEANVMARERRMAKKRVLTKEENSGFILISTLTCMGTLIVGTVIFMAIKMILLR